jgi:hypothetical protein
LRPAALPSRRRYAVCYRHATRISKETHVFNNVVDIGSTPKLSNTTIMATYYSSPCLSSLCLGGAFAYISSVARSQQAFTATLCENHGHSGGPVTATKILHLCHIPSRISFLFSCRLYSFPTKKK